MRSLFPVADFITKFRQQKDPLRDQRGDEWVSLGKLVLVHFIIARLSGLSNAPYSPCLQRQ